MWRILSLTSDCIYTPTLKCEIKREFRVRTRRTFKTTDTDFISLRTQLPLTQKLPPVLLPLTLCWEATEYRNGPACGADAPELP